MSPGNPRWRCCIPTCCRSSRWIDLVVKAVLADNRREFCGTDWHPYELYLDLNGIEHRLTRVRSPKTNGFVERFNGTVLKELFRIGMRETFCDSVEALQRDLDALAASLQHRMTSPRITKPETKAYRETINKFVRQEG